MKKLIFAALLFPTLAFAHPTVYPPGTPASAIAVDQYVKHHDVRKDYGIFCMFIDTATGKCKLSSRHWWGGA